MRAGCTSGKLSLKGDEREKKKKKEKEEERKKEEKRNEGVVPLALADAFRNGSSSFSGAGEIIH